MSPARREVAIGLGAYGAYLAVRRMVWNERGRSQAQVNARLVVEAERRCGVHVEPAVQRAALRAPWLVHALNAGYAAGNVALSVGWLISLYHRRDPAFRGERRAAVLAFSAALPVFAAFPVAPPRSLDGFVDTMASGGWHLDDPRLVRFYNPVAAMPSHHVAFATVTGLGLARRSPSAAGRWAWRGYPAAVAATVVATGNHFVFDVAAGGVVGLIARRLAR